ncbi:putative non-specific serine/threonine protein kinase [Dioscorea sansibarensis]
MQGHIHPRPHAHHHLQQQLAALLSAALPSPGGNGDGVDSTSSEGSKGDDSSRLAALNSLHCTIIYPPNSLLLMHSISFLSQGLSQLLCDKSFAVRRAAAVTYGSLSAIAESNGHQNHAISNGLSDRFIAWALPLLREIGSGSCSAELVLDSLREFLKVGDAGSIGRLVPSILKACQELLEDERTSLSLLHPLLGVLILISLKFGHCFQPHFVDVVDLLLGWAFVPDLSETDRLTITDTFLQFRTYWLSNVHFSLGLLSKFLGDMEVLIHDGKLVRLLALLACLSTVLQVIASGLFENQLLEQIAIPIQNMAPRILSCIMMFGGKFGWSKWMEDTWRCLGLLAEILRDNFSEFYSIAIDIFFQSLRGVPSYRLHGVLKANLQLLSFQKQGLFSSFVQALLQFQSPFSQLRLHPNHLVVAATTATYIYCLQHASDNVVSEAISSLVGELDILKGMLGMIYKSTVALDGCVIHIGSDVNLDAELGSMGLCCKQELLSLIRFDLTMLLSSVSSGPLGTLPNQGSVGSLSDQAFIESARYERSHRLTSFILEKFNPCEFPISCCVELQAHVVRILHKLSEIEILSSLTISQTSFDKGSSDRKEENTASSESMHGDSSLLCQYLRKYDAFLVRILHASSAVVVKLEAFNWISTFSWVSVNIKGTSLRSAYEQYGDTAIGTDLLFSILDATYDREPKVRSYVATILELLMRAGLIYSGNFYCISKVALDKLGDPDRSVKVAFGRVLAIFLPLTMLAYGLIEDGGNCFNLGSMWIGNKHHLDWKHVLAFKQLPRKFHSQQLVSVLSYVSQRSKMPLSSWIQRLVFSCCSGEISSDLEENECANSNGMWQNSSYELDMIGRMCPVNILASVWWSIHEAARQCVALRLRTNFGGAAQTFAALERMLSDIPNTLFLDTEQSESNLTVGSSSAHLLPMWLLLDFVEALKKEVYNAYEGSSVLPSSTRQSSLFFRANKKVCEEWFSRMCDPMMNAGIALDCHDATFHHCVLRLQDLGNLVASTMKDNACGTSENVHTLRSRLARDVLKVLRHAALALSRSHEPEALAGLQKWVVTAFPTLFTGEIQVGPEGGGGMGIFSWMTGLIYQAQGQYERAAAHFSHLLQSEDALSYMGADGIQFVIARVIESYSSLSDWGSLNTWLAELQTLRSMHAGKDYSGALTAAGNEINLIHALACFDEGDIQAACGYLDLTPKSSCELSLDPRLSLERSEQMLLRAMLERNDKPDIILGQLEKAKLMLDEALSIAPLTGLAEVARCATQLHCIIGFESKYQCSNEAGARQMPPVLQSLQQILHSPISMIHQDSTLWIKIFRVHRSVLPTSLTTLLLCQKLHRLARKQSNFLLADRMSQYFKDHLMACSEGKDSDMLALNLQYDSILLKYAEGKHEEALINLWSFVHADMLSSTSHALETGTFLKAKACLKLSSWLRQGGLGSSLRTILLKIHEDFQKSNVENSSSIHINGSSCADSEMAYDPNLNAILEEIVGTAIKLSCHLCPSMSKAWLSYASWCFAQASGSLPELGTVLQSCSLSPVLQPEISMCRFQLTDGEMSLVRAIITRIYSNARDGKCATDLDDQSSISFHPEKATFINSLVQQTACLLQAASGASGFNTSEVDDSAAALSSRLQMLFLGMHVSIGDGNLASIYELVDIWRSLRQRYVSLFGHAARGFFEYLSNSFSEHRGSHYENFHLDVSKEKAKKSCTLRAMLFILHILLTYGVELNEVFELGFAKVPLLTWQEITPQLFARLSSHPKQAIRNQLERLLLMLAKRSPWAVVYPTLVDKTACEGECSEEIQHLLDCLYKLHRKLVQDVQLVINELGMITVLWDEQWLSTLQDLHSDVMRRLSLLKDEAARIAGNPTLSYGEKRKLNAAKYSALMAPVVVALERRLAATSRAPETANEIWFQKEYREQLELAISAFKTPPGSAAALGEAWQPFDAIATSLASHQRKSSISLSEVAPRLALLSSSDVPMPGLEKQNSVFHLFENPSIGTQSIITVSSFSEKLTILSTKTRPKKVVLRGSDGQNYPYLLKGREDLRLDARIMQLLQAINCFLQTYSDTHRRSLAIRYYTVTPISGRAGLIQWVENVTSIYSVFKSWQNRSQLAQLSALGPGNVKDIVPSVPRPIDMFYGKIIPALKEKGLRRVISRKDWPHEVKRKVLLELMQETPRQLLWQEMWCASEGFKAFNLKAKRCSASVAAMSMVGHVLGLGDRHLDNILIDLFSGDVVHIDYNVCFDKGKRLKIPEIVPFRLTQIIEAALGLTGTEGTFRSNCEAVTGVLRKNKDIILMMLEVFVWDPLVEWTRGDNHDEAAIGGEEKKGMELAVSLSLFASRIQEIRVPLQEHHDLLLSTLPAGESALKRFLGMLNQYEVISAIYHHVDNEKLNLLQQEKSARTIVAELNSISEETHSSFEIQAHEFAQAKALATEKAKESVFWVEQHGKVLDALQNGSVPDVEACTRLSGLEDALSLRSAVLVSGIPLTVVPEPTLVQSCEIDREVSRLVAELQTGLSCALEALHEYALALQRVLPLNYITTTPVSGWAQLLQLLVINLSSDTLSLAKRQAAELIAEAKGGPSDSIKQRHHDLIRKMETYATEIDKVNVECSGLTNSIASDTEVKSKEKLLSAFTKYMQSSGFSKNDVDTSVNQEGQQKHHVTKDFNVHGDLDDRKLRVLSCVQIASNEIYKDVKGKLLKFSIDSSVQVRWIEDDFEQHDLVTYDEFEEQIEKCVLVSRFVNEIWELFGSDRTMENVQFISEGNWPSLFQACLYSCKKLIEQITEVILPDIIKSFISYNSEVMEAFGLVSQIRVSIDTALEKLVEVELERASLLELEKNYFVKVGLITEQQLALEEAAVKGRDNLSWEEAEELASQEEACRAKLDKLQKTWNEKDIRSASLRKLETDIKTSFASSGRLFSTLIIPEPHDELHIRGSKGLLAALAKPFFELESVDHVLSSYGTAYLDGSVNNVAETVASGTPLSGLTWRLTHLLGNHSFFIWKIGILDSMLDLCIHNISSSMDQNLGFDQLYNVVKKKLEIHLQNHVSRYLKGRLAPALMIQLDKQNENIEHPRKETDKLRQDDGPVKKVHFMLEEYCNAHENARAAKSAISRIKRQVNELTDSLRKSVLEIVQMEWLHGLSLPHTLRNKVLSQIILGNDKFNVTILNLSRPKLLEKLQSSVSTLTDVTGFLQDCERTSVSVEGQLERAMGWACASPSMAGTPGIPTEFHNHLLRRKKLLWVTQEQVSDIIKICTSVVEFEASRDDILHMPTEKSCGGTTSDGRSWQNAYLTVLTRLDVAYHSFTCAEQEWKLAKNDMEAAANSLFSATRELTMASAKAKSASGDLQANIMTMFDCAYEASATLSVFARVSRGHTALTSECGSMLEEVLAITRSLHDLYSLGKQAAAAHSVLMADLGKANAILIPLEVSLSTDLVALADAILKDKENKSSIPPIHGQALYESYCFRLREACQSLKHLVPSIICSVKELHSMLTKLGRALGLHAGNLHKALEGVGESQFVRSQELAFSRSDFSAGASLQDDKDKNLLLVGHAGNFQSFTELSPQGEEWISPPDYSYTSSLGSSISSSEASATRLTDTAELLSCNNPVADDMHVSCPSTQWQESGAGDNSVSQFPAEDGVTVVATSVPPDIEENMQTLSSSKSTDISTTSSDNGALADSQKNRLVPSSLNVNVSSIEDWYDMVEEGSRDDKSVGSKLREYSSKKVEGHWENNDKASYTDSANCVTREKNSYALSVLRQVELKLEGRENDEFRSMTISEQVDYLLKQATSIDNLCNMYEGWTPWI